MQANTSDISAMLSMQQVDLQLIRAKKQLEELPQRKVILAAREKRAAIQQKKEQLDRLHSQANGKLSRINDEDATLVEKQKRVQEEIDQSRGDYRSVEAHTKELNGFAKRRNALEVELGTLSEELAKIEGIQAQVDSALAAIDKQEQQATEQFRQQGGALQEEIAKLEAQRAPLEAELPAELAAQYAKVAKRAGGVAVGRLEEDRCGVCRMVIEGGRLMDMKAHAPLATCPHCKRMLVV